MACSAGHRCMGHSDYTAESERPYYRAEFAAEIDPVAREPVCLDARLERVGNPGGGLLTQPG